MAAGKPVQIAPSDAQRIWIALRLLPGSPQIYVSWGGPGKHQCSWPMGPPGPCCPPSIDSPLEREWWYGRHGGYIAQDLWAWLAVAGEPAMLQVVDLDNGEYLRDACGDRERAEEFSAPAGASPLYWDRCGIVTIR